MQSRPTFCKQGRWRKRLSRITALLFPMKEEQARCSADGQPIPPTRRAAGEMMMKRRIAWIFCLATLLPLPQLLAGELRETMYEGTWLTTNRQLDGRMTCVVTELAGNKWQGHFYGVWQGQSF